MWVPDGTTHPFPVTSPHDTFRYDGYAVDPATSTVGCRYATGGHTFTEEFAFEPGGDWDDPAVRAAVRLLYLVAGVSYYKTTAARRVDLGDLATTERERAFLVDYYVNGLGEFAYRNGLDLRGLEVHGPDAGAGSVAPYDPSPGRPLIPFGGGIDSIVTVEALAGDHPDAALCVVHPLDDRFAAIEEAAAVSGLPVRRVGRRIDPLVRRSVEMGFLNGHVPVTAVVTAAAVVAAVLEGRDAVVLSNEWSASVPTLVAGEVVVNHQWSKGESFERSFGDIVGAALGPALSVFSYLRPRTELWVAARFAGLTRYHGVFRSCNRAFAQDAARRLDRWCGRCDKCCFIDLVLAPFLARDDLAAVFAGAEPLEDPDNEERFRVLLGLSTDPKPFECVGDIGECRAAVVLAARRTDRVHAELLGRLAAAVAAEAPESEPDAGALLAPRGPDRIPERYAPADLLVRAR